MLKKVLHTFLHMARAYMSAISYAVMIYIVHHDDPVSQILYRINISIPTI